MNSVLPAGIKPLPVPPNYMRTAERNQLREMTGPVRRPDGDHRSAERIIEQSAVLSRFLESRDHYPLADALKWQVGDWTEANPNPDARADAAYNLEKVLRFIDNADDRYLSDSRTRNGQIDGFFNAGYGIRLKSEASLLSEFSSKGYAALRYVWI